MKHIKEKIKENLLNLQTEYNGSIEFYDENGEEDFNSFLDLFKDKEGLK